ncbi:oxidoreductase [Denitratisoma oestradiolicum]|uniref:Short-chain dehydrogenase/reductase SDR n=1 Tax=Denitratisoma oestradiolicum TaxID=311182 RepID=A0A6S6Y3A7_9PROT|nr:oxidoreductase [Denitratisoma oestradiolicum]TWO79958.1 short-chain dehydrogenase [Denitratisoma oestradiolicum]CAB1369716.1 Short-chain dehydrogenase/reductase SDR [Denitratisoma oestradiolicum]
MTQWIETDIPDLSSKRVLVTGAASGIGYEAARALALRGAEVLLADINQQGGAEALARIRQLDGNAKVHFRTLDLSSQQAVRAFVRNLIEESRPLDVLVNNAGIQSLSERRTTIDGFELTFGIGHLGHFTLTGLLLPLLLKSAAPRVVTVSSFMHKAGSFDWDDLQMEHDYSAQRAYNQTKLANLLFARELQFRAQAAGSNLLSLAVHPGVARTAIGANRKARGAFGLGDHMVTLILSLVMPLLGQPARQGAWPTLLAATAPEVVAGGFYGPTGIGGFKGSPALTKPAPRGQDRKLARKLWAVSEMLTALDFDISNFAMQDKCLINSRR